jgi:voltage-gated potassium channel Kch
LVSTLIAAVALSMALTPLLLIFHDMVLAPRLQRLEPRPEHDEIESEGADVVIAGTGRLGMIALRLLATNNVTITALDHDPAQIEVLRRFGIKVFYGDALRLDLLEAAGIKTAKAVVIALDARDTVTELCELVKRHYPHVKILARAMDRPHAYRLQDIGADHVVRETFASAIDLGELTLQALGRGVYRSHRAARRFRHRDERNMREMAHLWKDRKQYVIEARKRIEDLERTLQADDGGETDAGDHGWVAPPTRDNQAEPE